MTFEIDRLKSTGGSDNREFGGNMFSYTPTSDDLAAILGVGFFNNVFQQLQSDDQITVFHSAGVATLKVATSLDTGVVVNGGANGLLIRRVQIGAGNPPPDAEILEILTLSANAMTLTGVGFEGQEITLIMTEDAGDATITFSPTGPFLTSIVFSAVGQTATLKYILGTAASIDDGWALLGVGGPTNPVVT